MRRVHNISDADDSERREAGAIIIELALVMPFLVVLFITIVDLGLLIREHQVVQNAAREGARFSSLPQNCISCRPTDCQGQPPGCKTQAQVHSAIKAHVVQYMAQEGITIAPGDISLNHCFPMSVTQGGSTVTVFASSVSITYNRALLVAGAPFLPGGGVNLTGTAVFRDLYGPPCPCSTCPCPTCP